MLLGSETQKWLNLSDQFIWAASKCGHVQWILYHILLIKTEFPLLSELYPVLYYMQVAVCACVHVCMC